MIPTFQEINPYDIQWQGEAVEYFDNYDYSKGILEALFSGSVGSAKSVCGAHLLGKHLLKNKNATVLILRKTLKDLKRTFWPLMLQHFADIAPYIKSYHKTEMILTFVNGAKVIGDSYDKFDLEKFRSLELSGAIIEEASESTKELYSAIKMRVGRAIGVDENFILLLTNPDEPDHYIYKDYILGGKKVFYSLTEQNKFLPDWYIPELKKELDPQMAKRMLGGQWLSIQGETPYHTYDSNKQYLKNEEYKFNYNLPVDLMHDFNIGHGKPMSMAVGQIVGNDFHVAHEFIIEGFNTKEIIHECIESGILDSARMVRIFGDCNGKNKDTRGNKSDYDIIRHELAKSQRVKAQVEMQVPLSNPPIRKRQNLVNAQCLNDNNETRLYIYKNAPTVDEGFRLTKIKKGSTYQEDDSDRYQHVVTAVGYWIHRYKTQIENIRYSQPFSKKR